MGKLEDIAKTLRSRKRLPFDGKTWAPGQLILHLANEVRSLRKNQCKPGMRCIFRYDAYLDKIYGTDSGDQAVPHRALSKPPPQMDFPVYVDDEVDY